MRLDVTTLELIANLIPVLALVIVAITGSAQVREFRARTGDSGLLTTILGLDFARKRPRGSGKKL